MAIMIIMSVIVLLRMIMMIIIIVNYLCLSFLLFPFLGTPLPSKQPPFDLAI